MSLVRERTVIAPVGQMYGSEPSFPYGSEKKVKEILIEGGLNKWRGYTSNPKIIIGGGHNKVSSDTNFRKNVIVPPPQLL